MVTARRPPAVSTFAAMWAGGGVIGLLGVAFPISDKGPLELNATLAVFALAIAITAWLAADRMPEWILKAGVFIAILLISLVVSQSVTPQGVMLIAFTYVWVAIYAAIFFSRRIVITVSVLMTVSFGAAILVSGLPTMRVCWLVASITVAVAGLTLNHQSLRQRTLAVTDPLTGLLNRNGLLQAAARELAISGRTARSLTIAVIDLDGFKAVNDDYGHLAGDRVLADVARRWQATLRAGDVLARTGGDEFVLMLPATDERDAAPLLERLRRAADIAWSVGTTAVRPGDEFYDCLARADRALYGDKARRSRVPETSSVRLGSVATVEG
jgi:diguanylate cyclase (GGDEF)-like protein